MTDVQRMEAAYRDNPDIGRYRLADEAGVGEKAARLFLERQRDSMINVVSLTDWHVPYHDERAVNCALKFCEVTQPDIIVMHEVHDFYELSRFNKDPSRKDDLQEEIDIATKYFKHMREACPGSRIMLLNSNHLDRLRRFLWTEGRPLASLRALQIEKLIELQEYGIEYRENFLYHGVLHKHGDLVRRNSAYTAKAECEREGCSGVSGHTHRAGIHYVTKRGGSYVWVESGCLCSLDPEYINGVSDWQHSITNTTFERNGSQYFTQLAPIINGKMIYDGKIIMG